MFKYVGKICLVSSQDVFINHIYEHKSTTSTVFAMLEGLSEKSFWGKNNG